MRARLPAPAIGLQAHCSGRDDLQTAEGGKAKGGEGLWVLHGLCISFRSLYAAALASGAGGRTKCPRTSAARTFVSGALSAPSHTALAQCPRAQLSSSRYEQAGTFAANETPVLVLVLESSRQRQPRQHALPVLFLTTHQLAR